MKRYDKIYRYSSKRKVIAIYSTVCEAAKAANVPSHRMKRAIDNHIRVKGSIFSACPEYPNVTSQKWKDIVTEVNRNGLFFRNKILFPWEGKDGNFDIDGWAKICYYNT